jgi:SAM-dependent methyltransferase
MTEGAIIQLPQWLKTPAGEYLLAWEQRHLDQAVADVFGFHALQLGLPELEALGANRMPHRWLAVESPPLTAEARAEAAAPNPRAGARRRPGSRCTATSTRCPFESASLDLVVLPHSLELARDPHLTLREVERVLVPEGRVLILGFNPASLWGTRQRLGRMRDAWAWAPSATCSCRAPASSSATGGCATGCAS